MSLEKQTSESDSDYLQRLFAEADRSVKNLHDIKKNMQEDGVIGFCKECSADIFKDKNHRCSNAKYVFTTIEEADFALNLDKRIEWFEFKGRVCKKPKGDRLGHYVPEPLFLDGHFVYIVPV